MDSSAVRIADVNVESMAAFTAIVVLWALVRPSAVRDGENRPLPFSITPRLFVVLIYALTYLLLVATVYSFPDIVTKVLGTTFYFEHVKYVQDKAPFLAIFALGTLMTLGPAREVERAFLVWTHSAQNLHADVEMLARHLHHCAFSPSQDERQRSVDELKAFNFFVTDAGSQPVELASVDYWRKSASLLRLLNDWNKDRNDVLNKTELKLLDEINTSHQRKTQLALNIVRMLNHLGRDDGAERTVQEISDLIANTPHTDRARVAELEARLKSLVLADDTQVAPPVRMSSRQLQGYLAQIQHYFAIEYQMLVEQIALLTAKTVLLSGSNAAERLDALKTIGFKGLGRVQPVRLDRVLLMFLGILCAGFVIFFAVRYPQFLEQIDVPVLSDDNRRLLQKYQLFSFMALALIMAFAALFGAIIGSSKAHARARFAPWHVYLGAGLMAVVVFFTVQGARLTYFGESVSQVRELRQEARRAREQAAGQDVTTGTVQTPGAQQAPTSTSPEPQFGKFDVLYRIAPSALVPFFATVALCWLARQRRWTQPWANADDPESGALWERFWDGMALVGVVFVAYLASRGLREIMMISSRSRALINWQFLAPQLGLAFLIGATVVREARSAAHAQVVELERRPGRQKSPIRTELAHAGAD